MSGCRDGSRPRLTPHLLVRIHPKLLQLTVQRTALHSDELRGAGNIATKTQQLRLQILRLEHIARLGRAGGLREIIRETA